MPLSIDLFPGGATRVSSIEVGHFIQRHVLLLFFDEIGQVSIQCFM